MFLNSRDISKTQHCTSIVTLFSFRYWFCEIWDNRFRHERRHNTVLPSFTNSMRGILPRWILGYDFCNLIRLVKTLWYIYDSIQFPHIKWITIKSCFLQDAKKPQQGNDAVLTSQMPLQYVLRHISSVGDWRFWESRSFLLTTSSRPLNTCDDYTVKSTIMHSPI